jgi:hypothetical protein
MKSFAPLKFAFIAVVASVSAVPTLSPSLTPTITPSQSSSRAPSPSTATSTPSGTPTPIPGRDLILKEGLACLEFLKSIPALGKLTGMY